MSNRRKFFKTAGKGAVFSALALSSSPEWASGLISGDISKELKPVRIGIIGAENSHTIGFGKIFNIEKKFPGVEVKS